MLPTLLKSNVRTLIIAMIQKDIIQHLDPKHTIAFFVIYR